MWQVFPSSGTKTKRVKRSIKKPVVHLKRISVQMKPIALRRGLGPQAAVEGSPARYFAFENGSFEGLLSSRQPLALGQEIFLTIQGEKTFFCRARVKAFFPPDPPSRVVFDQGFPFHSQIELTFTSDEERGAA